jgi:hypothetical protein
MERYIGTLKSMVNLMSNIDANLANRAIAMECLHYLPKQDTLYSPPLVPGYTEAFPFPPTDTRSSYTNCTPTVLDIIRNAYPDDSEGGDYPITAGRVKLFTKFHLRWKCTIGSVHSQNRLARNRRDDSYIWWNKRNGTGREYGKVELFAMAYTYEAIAIVKPWSRVQENREFKTVIVKGELGRMDSVRIGQIGGLIGRIEASDESGKITYLVGNWDGEHVS